MFNWLFPKRRKSDSVVPDLVMRANIANKLKKYNADEDTTISDFSVPDDDIGKTPGFKMTPVGKGDVWSQANPGESGIWRREERHKRKK